MTAGDPPSSTAPVAVAPTASAADGPAGGSPASTPPAAPAATGAGKGVLYIAFAKLYFMVVGAVIEFRLTAILSRTMFGAYGVVASVVSPFNNVMVTGSI